MGTTKNTKLLIGFLALVLAGAAAGGIGYAAGHMHTLPVSTEGEEDGADEALAATETEEVTESVTDTQAEPETEAVLALSDVTKAQKKLIDKYSQLASSYDIFSDEGEKWDFLDSFLIANYGAGSGENSSGENLPPVKRVDEDADGGTLTYFSDKKIKKYLAQIYDTEFSFDPATCPDEMSYFINHKNGELYDRLQGWDGLADFTYSFETPSYTVEDDQLVYTCDYVLHLYTNDEETASIPGTYKAYWRQNADSFIGFTMTSQTGVEDVPDSPEPVADVEEHVEEIRSMYYEIQDEYKNYSRSTDADGLVTYEQGSYRKIVIPAGWNGISYSRELYFNDGALFFAFYWNDTEEHRLYFSDDQLFRYRDIDGNNYDNAFDDAVFLEWQTTAQQDLARVRE